MTDDMWNTDAVANRMTIQTISVLGDFSSSILRIRNTLEHLQLGGRSILLVLKVV